MLFPRTPKDVDPHRRTFLKWKGPSLGVFFQKVGTGKRENPWIISIFYAKSLIPEATPPTCCGLKSTGCASISTDIFFAAFSFPRLLFFFSLIINKKKKKRGVIEKPLEMRKIHGTHTMVLLVKRELLGNKILTRGCYNVKKQYVTQKSGCFFVHGWECPWYFLERGKFDMICPPEYAFPVAGHPVIGIDSPEKRRTSRQQCGFFHVRQHGTPYGRVVRGAFWLAGSFSRSVNPHDFALPFDSGERSFNRLKRSITMKNPSADRPDQYEDISNPITEASTRLSEAYAALLGFQILLEKTESMDELSGNQLADLIRPHVASLDAARDELNSFLRGQR